ncbi:hypothetical protein HII31_04639, partial [Pseudocercospora fuligena]
MDCETFEHDQQATRVAPSSPYELIAFKNTVTPADAIKKLWQGRDGFSHVEIQRNLRRIAITLYGHQKLASRYQSSMRTGRNTLLFFICAIHMRQAPTNVQETLNIKRTNPAEMVGLYYFECLYYAIIHDIRRLQVNVEEHLSKHPDSTLQLHSHGRDCERPNDPFTMTDLAEQLEEFWVLLTDYRLLGPLETCTRLRFFADTISVDLSKAEAEDRFIEQFNAKPDTEQKRILVRSPGMYDAASMSTQEIYNLLWNMFAPKIEAGFPDLNIEVWIHSRESLQQQQPPQQSESIPVVQSGLAQSERQQQPVQAETDIQELQQQLAQAEADVQAPADEEDDSAPQYPPCTCSDDCHCRVACEYGVGECQCHFRRRYAAPEQASRNLFDAPTNEIAQLQVATAAIGGGRPHMRQALQFVADAAIRRRGSSRPEPYRGRSTTIQNLHNVPDGLVSLRPVRTPKDIYPLGLYGEESGGRFPPFQATTTAPQPRPPNSTGQVTQSFSEDIRPISPPEPTEAELLPPPSFNSPPRAIEQHYVIAGGTKRLSQRERINF